MLDLITIEEFFNFYNFDNIFKKYDVILNKQFSSNLSLKNQYYKYYNKKDLNDIIYIIKNKFPKYYSITLKTFDSKNFYILIFLL